MRLRIIVPTFHVMLFLKLAIANNRKHFCKVHNGSYFLSLARVTPPFRILLTQQNTFENLFIEKTSRLFSSTGRSMNSFRFLRNTSVILVRLIRAFLVHAYSITRHFKGPVMYNQRVTSSWKSGVKDPFREGWHSM